MRGGANGSEAHTTPIYLADREGKVWVGFHGQGISCITTNGTRNFEKGLPGLYITSLAEDAFGQIWAGTGDGGIVRFDHGQVEVVVSAPGRQIVHALLPLEDGTLWYGVSPGGLVRVKEGVRATISRAQGLTEDAVFQMQLDENGWPWCGSGRGLFRVSLRELNDAADQRIPKVAVFEYGRSDGLADFPFCNVAAPATCRSRDGRFWFASAKGAVAFAPARLPLNREPPQVFIESVWADGNSIALQEELQFSPRIRELEIRFTATSFVAPQKVRFRYRLEGTQTDWVETGLRRLAVYSGLGPGTYRFQVLACNNDSVWDNQGASISFVIPPAFWETRRFLLLVVPPSPFSLACPAKAPGGGGRWPKRCRTLSRCGEGNGFTIQLSEFPPADSRPSASDGTSLAPRIGFKDALRGP